MSNEHLAARGASHPLEPIQVACATAVRLKIIDGKCKMAFGECWARQIDIPLPENCVAHYKRMLARPAVRQVLEEEGYVSALREAKAAA